MRAVRRRGAAIPGGEPASRPACPFARPTIRTPRAVQQEDKPAGMPARRQGWRPHAPYGVVLVSALMLPLAVAVTLAAQPKRIVSTAPSITETLFALGLGDRVVGVSTYCHFPPEAASRPRIGTYLRPN